MVILGSHMKTTKNVEDAIGQRLCARRKSKREVGMADVNSKAFGTGESSTETERRLTNPPSDRLPNTSVVKGQDVEVAPLVAQAGVEPAISWL